MQLLKKDNFQSQNCPRIQQAVENAVHKLLSLGYANMDINPDNWIFTKNQNGSWNAHIINWGSGFVSKLPSDPMVRERILGRMEQRLDILKEVLSQLATKE